MPPRAKTQKVVTAADAAIGETENKPVDFEFRGQQFSIPQNILDSARLRAVMARGTAFDIIRELLMSDPANFDRFLSVVKVGESEEAPLTEFFDAFNAAAGGGNSSAS